MATPPPPSPGSGNGNGSNQPTVPAVPSPAPGKLYDPDGKDISQAQPPPPPPDPVKEVQGMKPSVDPGGFDVSPTHVWYTSYLIRNLQTAFNRPPGRLLDALDDHKHVCGIGSGPSAFVAAYNEISALYLEVWALAVVAVGGVSTGLTITANNYVRAEYASIPGGGAPTSLKAVPDVIRQPPHYGRAADLGWAGSGGGSWSNGIIDNVMGVVGRALHWAFQQALKRALRHGKVADITPGGDDKELPDVAAAWRQIATDAAQSRRELNDAIDYLKTPDAGVANDEWRAAVGQFSTSLWGTRSWGKNHPSPLAPDGYKWNHSVGDQPVIRILTDVANAIADLLDRFRKEVTDVRDVIEKVYIQAAKDCMELDNFKSAVDDIVRLITGNVVGLAEQFIENLDTGKLDAGVNTYNANTQALAAEMRALRVKLDAAKLAVPSFQAEEARAQGIGARTITGFAPEHRWTVPGDSATNHAFPIDLANQEDAKTGSQSAHTIDRHVGKTEEQLKQRMLEQHPPAASTFPDLATAQRLTQATIDANNAEIFQKLAQGSTDSFVVTTKAPLTEPTGKTTSSANGPVIDAHNVAVRIQPVYDGRKPPFIVVTAFPEP
ncbi:RNase A-like domain-containing protein [Streptomyces wedmorensis]|uniref:RNase A-like domain-containing protein n=1 Tax=Streptomyces wedmorensis TaxID=43759 RepID=UPI00344821A7